jgi:hypothetical protein
MSAPSVLIPGFALGLVLAAAGCTTSPPKETIPPVVLIKPLYSALYLPRADEKGTMRCGDPSLPAEVQAGLMKTRFSGWGINSAEKLWRGDGSVAYRLLLSSGQSSHQSDDEWVALEFDVHGRLLREAPEVPRKGPFEDDGVQHVPARLEAK